MSNKRKRQQGQRYSAKGFVEMIEPYWKILLAACAIAGASFKIGVWVGEKNNLDEIIKLRSDYAEKITNLTIELANQDRKPIVINLTDSIGYGKQK